VVVVNIPFNKPPYTGNEEKYVLAAMKSSKMSGDGEFSKRCQRWFESKIGCPKSLLTTSCTHSLEMAAILLDFQEGDEVIMPSFTFVSTANPFVLRGAKVVFVDIRPDTMNMDECKIERAITKKTKAIVPVHYAGVACEMDAIIDVSKRHNLFVVEDAAQAMMGYYKGKPLGGIGDLGAFSFHETKNFTSAGEGGLLLINDPKFIERAEIVREKGTNRSQFFRGMVDKYSWVGLGSSYLPNDVSAAYLWGQLELWETITENRLASWRRYYSGLESLQKRECISLPFVPPCCTYNGHMFYIKVANLRERTALIDFLRKRGVYSVFHYVPLHSSEAGCRYGRFHGEDKFTTTESERLIRLPLYYGLKKDDLDFVIDAIYQYFK
jgi:dTDP-4-amino-4,6-dideoxygalactose transaminase